MLITLVLVSETNEDDKDETSSPRESNSESPGSPPTVVLRPRPAKRIQKVIQLSKLNSVKILSMHVV